MDFPVSSEPGYGLAMEKGMAAGARLLCVARKFSDSEVEFPPVSHTNALLITPAFQILNRNNVQ